MLVSEVSRVLADIEILSWQQICQRTAGSDTADDGASGHDATDSRTPDERERAELLEGLDAVFFDAANRRTFETAEERQSFHKLWLGQYLDAYPQYALIALSAARRVVGYTVGWPEPPIDDPRFAALGYFSELSDPIAMYPAHLHINLAPEYRGQRLGARLMTVLCQTLSNDGCRGVHVITEHDARNVGFYVRNQFVPMASVIWRQRRLICLGRGLA